ncbi:MAG: sulfatase-like hydrolase/transferase [Planctomycetota bacterium]
MKRILKSLLILLLACPAFASDKPPNVIILLADDLGSRDLGCYGGPVKTPVLDSLAARGVRFNDFHAGAAVCSPSRATLMTGRQNLRTGIYGVLQDHWHNMHLLEREVTIAEVLQKAGYGTAHFGKWHIGMTSGKREKPSPTQHGFDYWFGLSNGASPSHKDPVNFLRNGKRVGPLKGYSCQLVVDDAIEWLDSKPNPDQPFFMNIWFNEPHHKLAAPDEIVSLYGDLKDESAIYSATIDNTDRAVGRLVANLKSMGKLDNTLIIYSSDHGSYRTDRNGGLKGNKGSNFQGGLRSPGIFFWPDGFRGGRVENTPSGSVDLLPTICGLVGIDKPKGVHLDGADLSPLLTEKGTFNRSQPMIWISPSSGHLATLREGNYTLTGYRGYELPSDEARKNELLRKLADLAGIDPRAPNLGSRVTNTTFTSPEYNRLKSEFVQLRTFQEAWIPTIKAGGFSRFALYDLSSDPLQERDVSRQLPDVTERLKKKLLALYKDVMADAPDWNQADGKNTSSAEKMSMETRTRIHRLATTKRSIFDAFSYLNRLPDEPDEEEMPEDFAGRIFSRLANQEGRILLKMPPGMERAAYEGFKTLLRYEGTDSVGNCSACHSLSDFRDGKSHIVSKGGGAVLTPSLRNTGMREVDLQKAMQRKMNALNLKKSGEANKISDEYAAMRLNAEDVSNLIAFLKLLDDVTDERFRELILKASVLDTSSDFE